MNVTRTNPERNRVPRPIEPHRPVSPIAQWVIGAPFPEHSITAL